MIDRVTAVVARDGRKTLIACPRIGHVRIHEGPGGDDLTCRRTRAGGIAAARLRKMVTRDIGVLYFGLPLSDDPRSVLYSEILSVADLDRLGEDY